MSYVHTSLAGDARAATQLTVTTRSFDAPKTVYVTSEGQEVGVTAPVVASSSMTRPGTMPILTVKANQPPLYSLPPSLRPTTAPVTLPGTQANPDGSIIPAVEPSFFDTYQTELMVGGGLLVLLAIGYVATR